MAGFGDMASNHEPTVTYEGDNNVLVQQTSNWILRQWNELQGGSTIISPLASVGFLVKSQVTLQKKFNFDGQSRLTLECKYSKNFYLNFTIL